MARAASSSSQDMSELQEQNENLRAVIKEMREQMEQLGHQIPVSDKNLQPRSADKITEGICLSNKTYFHQCWNHILSCICYISTCQLYTVIIVSNPDNSMYCLSQTQ